MHKRKTPKPARSLEEVAEEYQRRHGGKRMSAKHVATVIYHAKRKLRRAIQDDELVREVLDG